VLTFIESRNQGDMDKNRSLDIISQRNPLSPAQDEVGQVKIMLMSSSLDKEEKRHNKESSCQAFFLICFISLLSIRRRTIKSYAI
jgi:hypothetical protein